MQRAALVIGVVAFLAIEAVLVARCVAVDGVAGTLARLKEPLTLAIVVDFTFVVAAVSVWLVRDAWRRGRSPWGWLALFVVVPTLGLYLFLLARGEEGEGSDTLAR